MTDFLWNKIPASESLQANPTSAAGHEAFFAVTAGFLGWALDAFDFFLVVIALPRIAADFHVKTPAIAFSLTLTLMFRPVGAFIFGLMADRYGRRIPMMIDLVFYSAVEVATGFAPNLTTFLILRALFGIGMGGEWGVGTSLVMEKVPAKWRGVLSGFLQEGYAAGYLLAAVAAFFMLDRFGWRPMFFLGGAPGPAGAVHPRRRQGIRCLAENQGRKLVAPGPRHRLALETLDLPDAPDGDDELLLARHAGHVSHVHEAFPRAGSEGLLADRDRDDDRRDPGRDRLRPGLRPLRPAEDDDRGPAGRAGGRAACGPSRHSMGLIVAGAFLMQFMVQGAWGIIPAHISELSPDQVRGFLPGFSYQCGNLIAASIAWAQAALAERVPYPYVMAVSAAAIFALAIVATALGRERRGIVFGKRERSG